MTKAELRRIAAGVAPTGFLSAAEYLGAVYHELKKHEPSYSYVKYTEDLGFGACNAMYLIIHGQRPLTLKGAQKIVAALELTGLARKYFLQLVTAQRIDDPSDREAAFARLVELKTDALPRQLDKTQLEFFNQWYNAAILELLSLPEASDDPAWIGSHLMPTVPPLKITKSLELLQKLGYVTFDKAKGRLVPSNSELSTGAEVAGLAVIRYHQQMIALAKDALTDVAPLERDISAVTIAVPADQIDAIKEKIRAFRRELLEYSRSATGADEIAQINVQLFPIGRLSARSKKS